MAPELRTFIERVIVPALVERFLREQAADRVAAEARELSKPEVRV